MELTQERLKELLEYHPNTGLFVRLKTAGNAKAGDIAGCVSSHGYISIKIDGTNHYGHRLAFLYMTGRFPSEQADHINHDTSDNRWANLRAVTVSENQHNRTLNINSKSGVSGVMWHKYNKKWVVKFRVDGKQKHFGYFDTLAEAVPVLNEARRLHGYHANHGI